MSTVRKCPFDTSCGYSTLQSRREYIKIHHLEQLEEQNQISHSLVADTDLSQPLYFWQLHSLLGRKPVISIVTNFYNRVYEDKDEDYTWFKEAFTDLASKEHHIAAQAAFWIDSFGGGRIYHGGTYRLNFHHEANAEDVMHAKGAERWMYHMRRALKDYESELNAVDERVFPCIVDFLKTKMMSYAKNHRWKFDDRDFDFAQDQKNEGTKDVTHNKVDSDPDQPSVTLDPIVETSNGDEDCDDEEEKKAQE